MWPHLGIKTEARAPSASFARFHGREHRHGDIAIIEQWRGAAVPETWWPAADDWQVTLKLLSPRL